MAGARLEDVGADLSGEVEVAVDQLQPEDDKEDEDSCQGHGRRPAAACGGATPSRLAVSGRVPKGIRAGARVSRGCGSAARRLGQETAHLQPASASHDQRLYPVEAHVGTSQAHAPKPLKFQDGRKILTYLNSYQASHAHAIHAFTYFLMVFKPRLIKSVETSRSSSITHK
jgi:hypothetical protein